MNVLPEAAVSRAEIEDFLFHEADLLDNWRLDEWLSLMTEDAAYFVPPNDRPDADHASRCSPSRTTWCACVSA